MRTTEDPKTRRITVRISDKDRALLQAEARRLGCSVGGALRSILRENPKTR